MRAIVMAAILIGGCQYVPGTYAYQSRAAQNAVAAVLYAPGKARFRGVAVVEYGGQKYVCGEVSAATRLGEQTNFFPFAYLPTSKEVALGRADVSPLDAAAIPEGCAVTAGSRKA